jgi:hypothetical protein
MPTIYSRHKIIFNFSLFCQKQKKNHHNLLAELKFPFSAYEKKERKKKAKEKSNIYELIKILI